MPKDYYSMLGVPRTATTEDIKKSYRKLAMQYHPDRNPGKEKWANDKFKEINEAFAVLGDTEKKKQYDTFGSADGVNPGDIFRRRSTRSTFEDVMGDYGNAGLNFDFLDQIFGGNIKNKNFTFRVFRGAPGGNVQYGNWPPGSQINLDEILRQSQRPPRANYEISIRPEEAKKGTKKILTRNGKRLEVKIPSGIKNGGQVKLGNALSLTDGTPGDIIITVKLSEAHAHRK